MVADVLVAERITDPSRVFIQSFEVGDLVRLHHELMPARGVSAPLVMLYEAWGSAPPSSEALAALCADGITAVGPWKGDLLAHSHGARFVRDALGLGMEVHAYTLRREREFLTLEQGGIEAEIAVLASMGVTGLFADFPDAVQEYNSSI